MNFKLSLVAVLAFIAASLGICPRAATAAAAEKGREKLSLDLGWQFHLGDIPFPVIKGHEQSYSNAKAGKAWGAAAPEFDDSDWRVLNLPHDWAVEGGFDKNENLSQGYRARGFGWYRRHFKLDPADKGRHIELQFDGVATHCEVWVNGTVLDRNWCGYTSFYVDITPLAKYGDDSNVIAVRVDANAMEGWWYEGACIYRHTWLVKRDPVHIVTDGICANPIRLDTAKWSVPVEVTINSAAHAADNVEVEATLIDNAGKEIATGKSQMSIKPFETLVAAIPLTVDAPHLWSVDEPTLYRVRTTVKRDSVPIDSVDTTCGFRTIRFDADKGFFLNDQPLKLKGVCNHQDHAGVGVAIPDSLWDFRLRKLKEMGANAYRCSHNPPSAEFLEDCDRLGLLVMDENRNFNSSPDYMAQLDWLVRRDRSHPSVILWSVFNEEPMQGTEAGYEMVRRMVAEVKRFDTTRPVTAAQSNGQMNPINVSQAVDVVGFNYQSETYDRFHAANPKLPMTSSEDTSAFETRGEWSNDRTRHISESYDTQRAPWGLTHQNAWKAVNERPYIAGQFVWTGFDYRGEPTPFSWPSVSSVFGCMDLCGFPKLAFFEHQAEWIDNRPVLTLQPHWNWSGKEGKPIKVVALSNAQTVTLILNGKEIGEKAVDKYTMVSWDVPYEAGKLEAIAKNDGKEVARTSVETTGKPVALRLVPDRADLAGDGWDAEPVTIEVVDSHGRSVPDANLPVDFEISGPGTIIGLGNGDPTCHEPEKGTQRSLFNGLAQVILQTARSSNGQLVLRAKSEGLTPAEVTINVGAAPERLAIAPDLSSNFLLRTWRMSPVSAAAPDPNQTTAENDMNSWSNVRIGRTQPLNGGNFVMFRSKFTPQAVVQKSGGTLTFKKLEGKAAIWMDGKLLGQKTDFAAAPLSVPVPPSDAERVVTVVIESEPGKPAGLAAVVTMNK